MAAAQESGADKTGAGLPAVIANEPKPRFGVDEAGLEAGLITPASTATSPGENVQGQEEKNASARSYCDVMRGLARRAMASGHVEEHGIAPIPAEKRTGSRTVDVLSLWFCMSANILPIIWGMLGPTYGLSLRDCSLIIIFFNLLTAAVPSYLCMFGPKTGMRQMIQARYSFGRYLVSIPVVLNLASLTCISVIMVVTGGQCLSAVGRVSNTVAIVILALLGMVISFCGYRALHLYERWAWIPALIALVVATGTGGSTLKHQAPVAEPPPAASVLTYGMLVASFTLTWGTVASDFTTYLEPKTSSTKIFLYAYLGLTVPTIPLMILGSAMGGAVSQVPAWQAAYDANPAGGPLAAMLAPAGGFGKFLVVVLAFTLLGNLAATSYSVTLNLQMLLPVLLRVPRYVFAVVFTAVVIPVGIRAAADFFNSLEDFASLMVYWASAFLGVVLTENLCFRRGAGGGGGGGGGAYDPTVWNTAARLPPGWAAMAAAVLSFWLVIPSMALVWWTGPIAATTGDIAFELAFVVSAALYVPLRHVEKRWCGR